MIDGLKARLSKVEHQIQRLEGQDDAHLKAVGEHFHLGTVGGSGRNTQQLNKRRERSLDRTIDRAKQLTGLYQERADLQRKIHDIETDGPAKRAAAAREVERRMLASQPGDTLADIIFGEVQVVKANRKSITVETANGHRMARDLCFLSPMPERGEQGCP